MSAASSAPLPDRLVLLMPGPDLTTVPVEHDTDALVRLAGLADRAHLARLLRALELRDEPEPPVTRLGPGRFRVWVGFRDLVPPTLADMGSGETVLLPWEL